MKNSYITKILSITAVIASLAISGPYALAETIINTSAQETSTSVKGQRPALVTTLSPDAVYMHTAYVSAIVRPSDTCKAGESTYGFKFGRGGVWFRTTNHIKANHDGIITYKAKNMTSGGTFMYQAFVTDCTGTTYGKIRKFTTKVAASTAPVVQSPETVVPAPVVDTKAAEKAAKEEAKKAEDAAKQAEKDKKEAEKKAALETKKAEDASAKKAADDAAKKAAETVKKEVAPVVTPITPDTKVETTPGSTVTTPVAPEAPAKEKPGFVKWLLKGNTDK